MSANPSDHPHRGIKSYVLRTGRMTPAQRRGLDDHLADRGLSVADGPLDQVAAFGRIAPLVLEIGFGMGLSLAAMAKAAPERDFIGIEVHPPGVGKLLALCAQRGIDNVRVYNDDAVVVIEQCIADASLAAIQIYFPDPWPKKRHHKRRLIQPPFIALLTSKLAAGGTLHLATDWEPYAVQMLEVLSGEAGLANLSPTGDFIERPAWRPETRFEQRGARLGHGVWDLLFERSTDG